ncbi:MAG TPA: peptide deformylase [Acidimicrobiales bacterium]|nr:peptide deformylase [Acidimicrobiales bacterium]
MATHPIRVFGDPVLRQPTREVDEIDAALVQLADEMLETMYAAPGVGLAAPQVGVQRRFFVYDVGDGPGVIVNPRIVETSGTWTYLEGCLSVPDLHWEIVRPARVHLVGIGLDGRELDLEADELLGRCFQHEVDHLDGTLLVERLEAGDRKDALRILRERALAGGR